MDINYKVPHFSVINFSRVVPHDAAQRAIVSVNRQIREDFAPLWGILRELQLHKTEFDPKDIGSLRIEPVQGDGVLYMVDSHPDKGVATIYEVLAYHALNAPGIPFGI